MTRRCKNRIFSYSNFLWLFKWGKKRAATFKLALSFIASLLFFSRCIQRNQPGRLQRQICGLLLLPPGLHVRVSHGNHRLLRKGGRVLQDRVRGDRVLHRLPLLPLGVDQHSQGEGRIRRDEDPTARRQELVCSQELRGSQGKKKILIVLAYNQACILVMKLDFLVPHFNSFLLVSISGGRRNRFPRPLHNWSQRQGPPDHSQRSPRRQRCGRDSPTCPSLPIHRQTRRGLPRWMEARQEDHEAQQGRCLHLLGQSRQLVWTILNWLAIAKSELICNR